jgi:hypothetical protein
MLGTGMKARMPCCQVGTVNSYFGIRFDSLLLLSLCPGKISFG